MNKLLVILFLAIGTATAHAHQIQTGAALYPTVSAVWEFSEKPQLQLQQVKTTQALPLQNLHLTLIDGKTKRAVALSAAQVKTDNATLTASQSGGGLQVTQQLQSLSPQNNGVLWKIVLENKSAAEMWLETGLGGTTGAAGNLRFWDGYRLQEVKAETLARHTPDMAFPATMLWSNPQSDALVIAMHPDNDISWMTTSLDPQSKTYFYGGRLAIPPGQSVTLQYALFTLQPRFGELDAIDGYYGRFPLSFIARPNTDPRLTGFRRINSSYNVRHALTLKKNELPPRNLAGLGRTYAGWDWGYNTYKFTGDWYGRPDYWNFELSAGDQAAFEKYLEERSSFDLNNIEQFHRDRVSHYKKGDLQANTAIAFYLVNFIQSDLAVKNDWMKYTYGYFTADVQTSGRIKHWVSAYDDTWHIFPWATPFAQTFKHDLPQILKELSTSTFALDVYADSSPYRGTTTEYIPGWSYDEKGKFIATNLAYKQLVKFIHTLRKDQFGAGVVANLSPWQEDPALRAESRKLAIANYSSVFAPDAYVVEGDASNQIDYDQPGRLFPKRYLFGKKYISSVSGAYQDKIGERIPWRTMSPNQIRAAYLKYLKKRVMAYYQGGLLPNYDDARGIALIANEIPRLLEIESRGFSAAPASTGDAGLQRRRYGDRLGAAIVYSNPTDNEIKSRETLWNRYFAGHAHSLLLPFEDSGAEISFTGNDNTGFSLSVPGMENRIVLLPLSLQLEKPQPVQGTTRADLQVHQQTYTTTIKLESASKTRLQARAPRDFTLREIAVNGKKIVVDNSGNATAELVAGENRIQVLCASTQFLSSPEALAGFDWKQFQIVVQGSGERLQAAAQILSDYAEFRYKFKPAITIGSSFEAPRTAATIYISADPSKRGVQVDASKPGALSITGNDDFDTQQLAWQLCRVLDRNMSLASIPGATFTNRSTKAMLDKIGLMANVEKSHEAKPITVAALQPVLGEDKAPSESDISALDFRKILPLPRAGWTATAISSYQDPGNPIAPEKALDGVGGTRWTAGRGKAGTWYLLDMQETREFNHVQLQSPYPYKYFPRHYKAELSDDGTHWRDAINGEGNEKDTDIFWPTLQKARFVRITLTQEQSEFWSIDEILVYKRVLSQTTSTVPSLENLPQLAIPLISEKITLDGRLDEAFWQKAVLIDGFSPVKEHVVTQPTQVRIFHDAKYFYLGINSREANMDKLWEPATERDGAVWSGDDVEIYLSPGAYDGQVQYPYYQLLFSPSGVQTDLRFDAQGKGDIKWNADWQVKTHKEANGWSAEVAIPLAALGGSDAQVWRANIGRIEIANGEVTSWAPLKRIFAQPALFGVWKLNH